MRKIFKVFLIYIFLFSNTYSETTIFHEKKIDGTRFFDIKFMFKSKHSVKKNFNLLSDFLKIHRFNPSVHKTEIVGKDYQEKTILKTTFRNCIHFFCREMIMYESILSYCIDDKLHCVINAEVLPNQESPVYSGKTYWEIKESSKGSKISYKSQFTADIFLPPFFGESIFKKTINRNLMFLKDTIDKY